MREAAAERERGARRTALRSRAEQDLRSAQEQASRTRGPELAKAYQAMGGAQARSETLQTVIGDYERRAKDREQYATSLRKQIDDLKAQLQRYSEALENDLQSGRDRIASRVREALGYEQAFQDASATLLEHLRGRPECRELLEDVAKEMAEEHEARAMMTQGGGDAAHPR